MVGLLKQVGFKKCLECVEWCCVPDVIWKFIPEFGSIYWEGSISKSYVTCSWHYKVWWTWAIWPKESPSVVFKLLCAPMIVAVHLCNIFYRSNYLFVKFYATRRFNPLHYFFLFNLFGCTRPYETSKKAVKVTAGGKKDWPKVPARHLEKLKPKKIQDEEEKVDIAQ